MAGKRLSVFSFFPLLIAGSIGPCSIERATGAGRHIWLLCQEGEVYFSPDEGTTWQVKRLPAEARLRAITFLDSRRGFVAGNEGTLLATEDGGETWRRVPVPTEENLTSIYFVGELGWLSGWTGLILHSPDGGSTWVRQPAGVQQGLESVFFLDASHGWAVGWVGTILRTADGGRTWEKARTPATSWSLHSVYFRDATHGWAVGFNGQILRSRDGGRTWEAQASPVQTTLTSILFDAFGRGWITADNQLLLSEDGGESWKAVAVDGPRFLRQLLALNRSLWVVGRFGVLRQDGAGVQFRTLATLPAAGGSHPL